MAEEIEFPRTILYCTNESRLQDASPQSIRKEVPFSPCDKDNWNFEDVFLFLNSLSNFEYIGRARYTKYNETQSFTMLFGHRANKNFKIRFSYHFNDDSIEMKGSCEWILADWTKQSRVKKTKMGTKYREMSHEADREMIVFYKNILVDSNSSLGIIKKACPIFYCYEEFSDAFTALVSVFGYYAGSLKEKFGFGYDFYHFWNEETIEDKSTSEERFFKLNQGYIRLFVSKEKK